MNCLSNRGYILFSLLLLLPSSAPTTDDHYRYLEKDEDNSSIEFYDVSTSSPGITKSEISIGDGAADSSTGVSHFDHVHAPHLKTFVFANGRHQSSGINSYVTVNFNTAGNPFEGATETLIDSEVGGGTYTWVSTSTYTQTSTDDDSTKHYVLFSGGNDRQDVIFPSVLYSFAETSDGTLQTPILEWQATPRLPARFGKLVDLGDISMVPDDPTGPLASRAGFFDIIIAGFGGLDIYSLQDDGSWVQSRNQPIVGQTAITYVGVDLYYPNNNPNNPNEAFLVVMNRSEWRITGDPFDAPCFFYDYRAHTHYHYFAEQGQTVSVAVIDDNTHLLLGAGGNQNVQGQPNLMLRFTTDATTATAACEVAPQAQQLVPGAPTAYDDMKTDDAAPTAPEDFVNVAFSGLTKTRQVIPFRLDAGQTRDHIVEVNQAQPAYIYCRNGLGQTFRIIPLPGTEGENVEPQVFARAADVIVQDTAVYIVVAMLRGQNLVYTVDRNLLLEGPIGTPAPTPNPTTPAPTNAPTPPPTTPSPTTAAPITTPSPTTAVVPTPPPSQVATQKEAPLEPKCGSVASSSGYGGVGGESKGCTSRRTDGGDTKKRTIRGRPLSSESGYWP